MKNDFYDTPHRYYVYLLLLDMEDESPYFYVGKSNSGSISKVYSKHIHAGFSATRNIFSCDAKPNLHILQDCLLTDAEAYRYVVAYIKWFSENGLGECLNYDGTTWQAEFLKPQTRKIYEAISREPVAELLQRTYVIRASNADRSREPMVEREIKRIVQLNIGVEENTKTAFRTYCKQLGVSQREAFGLLMDASSNQTEAHLESVVTNKEKRIEKQRQEIEKLQQKLALATGKALPRRELWASAMVPFLLAGVKQYIQFLFPQRVATQPVKSRSYKSFTRGLLPHEEFIYPEEEGFYVIRLQAVLWGNNKSCFYAGIGSDGKHYRFRYFAKEWFTGIPPRGSGYEEQDSLWLMGCKKASDGAMDLVAAFPLPGVSEDDLVQKNDDNIQSERPPKPSLVDRLADIERRTK